MIEVHIQPSRRQKKNQVHCATDPSRIYNHTIRITNKDGCTSDANFSNMSQAATSL